MAICYVCTKAKQYGHNVSHSKRRTKRVFLPNIFGKRMRVVPKQQRGLNGEGKIQRVKICAKCLKRAKKFGFVEAEESAKLSGFVVQVVNWQELVRQREQVGLEEEAKAKAKESKPKEAEKEISVAELVGKRAKK